MKTKTQRLWTRHISAGDTSFTYVLGYIDNYFIADSFCDANKNDIVRLKTMTELFAKRAQLEDLPSKTKRLHKDEVLEIGLPERGSPWVRGQSNGKIFKLVYPPSSSKERQEIVEFAFSVIGPNTQNESRKETLGEVFNTHLILMLAVLPFCGAWLGLLVGVDSGGFDDFDGKRSWIIPFIQSLIDEVGLVLLLMLPLSGIVSLAGFMAYRCCDRQAIELIHFRRVGDLAPLGWSRFLEPLCNQVFSLSRQFDGFLNRLKKPDQDSESNRDRSPHLRELEMIESDRLH